MSDLELARRILAGDESASEAFFADYFPRLYRFARLRLGNDDQAAEDVVQLTLIRAVRKLHTFRGEAALFTWLCTLCRREISAWLQHSRRTADVALLEDHPATRIALEAAASLAGTDPESETGRRELSQLVQTTLAGPRASNDQQRSGTELDRFLLSLIQLLQRRDLGHGANYRRFSPSAYQPQKACAPAPIRRIFLLSIVRQRQACTPKRKARRRVLSVSGGLIGPNKARRPELRNAGSSRQGHWPRPVF
ncbi:MAG: sigma-70 family RNA polymerase sigma factor [Acidobacteria bacterium]|nr:sigma-70 family RNA polymerase sigma factor [Acidobacteriota bacterium]